MDYRLEQLRYALREDPSSRQFYQLGELLRRDGQLEEAVQVLRQGLSHHPRYVSAHIALGRALISTGDYGQAEEVLASALQLDPENAVAARLIGQSAMERGDPLRAIQALKLARALGDSAATLEEEIAAVETELARQGLLQGAAEPSPVEAAAPELALDMEPVPDAEPVLDADESPVASQEDQEPFAVGEGEPPGGPVAPAEDGPFAEPEPAEPARGVGEADEAFAAEPFVASSPEEAAATSMDGELGAEEAPFEAPASEAAPEDRDHVWLDEDAESADEAVQPKTASPTFEVPEEDPFAVEASGDTGVWTVSADVFGEDAEPEQGEGEVPFDGAGDQETLGTQLAADHDAAWVDSSAALEAGEPALEVEKMPEPAPSTELAEPAPELELQPEQEPEREPEHEAIMSEAPVAATEAEAEGAEAEAPGGTLRWEQPPEPEPEPALEDRQPEAAGAVIATPTMVRLALGQGDVELAASTLAALAADNPDHPQLAELETALASARRESIVSGVSPAADASAGGESEAFTEAEEPSGPTTGELLTAEPLQVQKIAALRSWLQAIRLASGTVEL